MDQILSSDSDLISDDFESKSNSLVNSSGINFLECLSNAPGNESFSKNNNESIKSDCKVSEDGILKTENTHNVRENNVAATPWAEKEIISNGDDSSLVKKDDSTCNAVEQSKDADNRPDVILKSYLKPVDVSGENKFENNINFTETKLALPLSHVNDVFNSPSEELEKSEMSADTCVKPNQDQIHISGIDNFHYINNDKSNLVDAKNCLSKCDNDFVPTIVEIRGGCTDVARKPSKEENSNHLAFTDNSSSDSSKTSNLNIVSVFGSFKDSNACSQKSHLKTICDTMKSPEPVVYTISDVEDRSCESLNHLDNQFNSDMTIKQEPPDNVSDNDCMYVGTEHTNLTFTSEIFIKEEKTLNEENEDSEVYCIETFSKIPLPIPIKVESNIENEIQSTATPTKLMMSKKRTHRPASSKSDDCVILSSDSDANDSYDSKNHNRLSTRVAYSTISYTCHLCDTVFQEHELLNEHMILHRNNSLIEAKVQQKPKTKMKTYTCDICRKRLSTSQSLQQHVLIHRNEKPYSCSICSKDFRHLSNYRGHMLKHKAEQRRREKQRNQSHEQPLDKSVVRGVDFGRLVGPLFMKETLLNQKGRDTDTKRMVAGRPLLSMKETTQQSLASRPLSFDKPSFKAKDYQNSPSSLSPSSTVVIKRRVNTPESISDDEVVPVKTFNNIENIVMNATRIIVKLDNLDPSLLKRKLQTPDISIDHASKKCKIMLSPIAEKCNVKLDEIENIPMDTDVDPSSVELPDDEDDCGGGGDAAFDDQEMLVQHAEIATSGHRGAVHGTLTDHELFELLNDDKDSTPVGKSTVEASNVDQRQIQQSPNKDSSSSVDVDTKTSPKSSNVIFMGAARDHNLNDNDVSGADDTDVDVFDAFDVAFHRVAIRRLTLLRRRAAENDGKVDSRFLLGPRFWHKALRRAKMRTLEATAPVPTTVSATGLSGNISSPLKLWSGPRRYGSRNRMDDRRTNDPAKLQSRAENKFKRLLERAKIMSDINAMNLVGPLFWRRTLHLAGVKRGEDLRQYMRKEPLTLDDVEFVMNDGASSNAVVDLTLVDPQELSADPDALQENFVDSALNTVAVASSSTSPATAAYTQCQQSNACHLMSLSTDVDYAAEGGDGVLDDGDDDDDENDANMMDVFSETKSSSPPRQQQPTIGEDAPMNTPNGVRTRTDSILYESLTKPKESALLSTSVQKNRFQSSRNVGIESDAATVSVTSGDGGDDAAASAVLDSVSKADGRLADRLNRHSRENVVCDTTSSVNSVNAETVATTVATAAGNLILNVDGGLQLIASDSERGQISEGTNYMLVSDETGTMQYMVNVPADNYGNFELISDPGGGVSVDADGGGGGGGGSSGGGSGGGGGEQVAYAIQFDGENYTAVQFVQDGGVQLQNDNAIKEDGKVQLVDEKAAAFIVTNAIADPNHIGKELSDFLNLDYGNLLKTGSTDQTAS